MARRFAIAGLTSLVLGGITLGLLLVAGRSLYSRAAFGTWDPAAQPTRISYCDRSYLPGSHVNRAWIDAAGNDFGVFPFRQVGATASGAGIYAKPLSDSERHNHGSVTLPCTMVLYLKVGTDDYVAYGLSGGP
jgi:hypothetical protein